MNSKSMVKCNSELFRSPLDKEHQTALSFNSVSYMCWAYRRQGVTLEAGGKIKKWLY